MKQLQTDSPPDAWLRVRLAAALDGCVPTETELRAAAGTLAREIQAVRSAKASGPISLNDPLRRLATFAVLETYPRLPGDMRRLYVAILDAAQKRIDKAAADLGELYEAGKIEIVEEGRDDEAGA